MSKCKKFLEFFDELVKNSKEPIIIPEDVKEFYDVLSASQENFTSRPAFTETGLIILKYLQNCDTKTLKAKDIADGVTLSSRKVSGAMRKLVNDGYVEKFGQNPVIYTLTNKGKNLNLEELNN